MFENKCKDCLNLSARDVFNGVCVIQNKPILIDTLACDDFVAAQKCKYCEKYGQSDQDPCLGVCEDGVMVFPDLTGCEDFVVAKQ